MEQKVCRYNKFGFCKHKEMCRRRHFTDECKHLSGCKTLGSLSKDIPNRAKTSGQCKYGKDFAYKQLEKVVHALVLKRKWLRFRKTIK